MQRQHGPSVVDWATVLFIKTLILYYYYYYYCYYVTCTMTAELT